MPKPAPPQQASLAEMWKGKKRKEPPPPQKEEADTGDGENDGASRSSAKECRPGSPKGLTSPKREGTFICRVFTTVSKQDLAVPLGPSTSKRRRVVESDDENEGVSLPPTSGTWFSMPSSTPVSTFLSAPPSSRGGTPPSDVKGKAKAAAPPPDDEGEEEVVDEEVESEDDDDATQKRVLAFLSSYGGLIMFSSQVLRRLFHG